MSQTSRLILVGKNGKPFEQSVQSALNRMLPRLVRQFPALQDEVALVEVMEEAVECGNFSSAPQCRAGVTVQCRVALCGTFSESRGHACDLQAQIRSKNHRLRRRDLALPKALNLLVEGSIPSGLTIGRSVRVGSGAKHCP